MNGKSRIFGAILLALLLLGVVFIGVGFFETVNRQVANADTISAWQVTTMMDGATSYTTTATSGARFVPNYAHFEILATLDVSGTGTVTVIPQFALSTVGCGGTISNWADAKDWTAGSATALKLAFTADGTSLLAGPVHGTCARVKITNTIDFTPTVVMRLVNRP